MAVLVIWFTAVGSGFPAIPLDLDLARPAASVDQARASSDSILLAQPTTLRATASAVPPGSAAVAPVPGLAEPTVSLADTVESFTGYPVGAHPLVASQRAGRAQIPQVPLPPLITQGEDCWYNSNGQYQCSSPGYALEVVDPGSAPVNAGGETFAGRSTFRVFHKFDSIEAYRTCLVYQLQTAAGQPVVGGGLDWALWQDNCIQPSNGSAPAVAGFDTFAVIAPPGIDTSTSDLQVRWAVLAETYASDGSGEVRFIPGRLNEPVCTGCTNRYQGAWTPLASGPPPTLDGPLYIPSPGPVELRAENPRGEAYSPYEFSITPYIEGASTSCGAGTKAQASASQTSVTITAPASASGRYLWCARAKQASGANSLVGPGQMGPWVGAVTMSKEEATAGLFGERPTFAMAAGVNAASGNWTFARTDVSLPSTSPGLAVSRTFNSLNEREGSFGPGWSWSFDLALEFDPADVVPPAAGQQKVVDVGVRYPDGTLESHAVTISNNGDDITPDYLVEAQPDSAGDLVHNTDGTWTLTFQDKSRLEFDQSGRLLAKTDRWDTPLNRIELTRNGEQVSKIRDVFSERELTLTWQTIAGDPRVKSVSVPNPSGLGGLSTWTYDYDGAGRLISVCDPRGVGWCEEYGWDGSGRMTSLTQSTKQVASAVYDSLDRVATITWNDGTQQGTTSFLYEGELFGEETFTDVTDPRGHVWRYVFNTDGQVITSDAPDFTRGGITYPGVTTHTYEGQLRSSTSTPRATTNAGGVNTTTFEYDDRGNLVETTTPFGQVTSFAYDDEGRQTLSCPQRSGYTFEADQQVESSPTTILTRGQGANRRYCSATAYTALNDRVISTRNWITPSQLSYERTKLDPLGRVQTRTDAAGRETRYFYLNKATNQGARGDLYLILHPSGAQERLWRNAWGQVVLRRWDVDDTRLWLSSTTYDTAGRVVIAKGTRVRNAVTRKLSRHAMQYSHAPHQTTTVAWDDDLYADSAAAQAAGAARVMTYDYDWLGRETSSAGPAYTDVDGNVVNPTMTRSFDSAGNVSQVCDARGICTTSTFDERNRAIEVFVDGVKVSENWYWDNGLIQEVQDGEGHRTRYNYDELDRLQMVRRATVDTDPADWAVLERRTYVADTDLVKELEMGGQWLGTVDTYRPLQKVNSLYGPSGHRLVSVDVGLQGERSRFERYTYFADGQLAAVKVEQPFQTTRTTTFGYDSATGLQNQVVVDSGGLNLTTESTHDSRGNVTSITDPRGFTTNFTYDGANQLMTTTLPEVDVYAPHASTATRLRPTIVNGYDAFGNTTQVKDPAAVTTSTTFDSHNRVSRILHPHYARPLTGGNLRPDELFWYDENGNIAVEESRTGERTSYVYDTRNRVAEVRAPGAAPGDPVRVSSYVRDGNGLPISVTDASGATNDFAYDKFGNIITSTAYVREVAGHIDAYSSTGSTHHDSLGRPIRSVSPEGIEATWTYDGFGRVKTEAVEDRKSTYTYNLIDQVTRTAMPGGFAQTTTYDNAGRTLRVEQLGPNNGVLGFQSNDSIDEAGNVLASTNQQRVQSTHSYDELGRLTSSAIVSVTPSVVADYGYDVRGNLAAVTAGGHTTTYMTNAWGLAETTREPAVFPNEPVERRDFVTEYDAAGRPALTRSAGSGGAVELERTYDRVGRLLRVDSLSNPARFQEFSYDAVGKQLSARSHDLAAPQTFVYDDVGQLLHADGPSGESSYRYDGDGRLTWRRDPGISAWNRFWYTPYGEVATHRDALLQTTTDYTYNDAGQLTSAINPDGAKQYWVYANTGNLSTQWLRTGADANKRVDLRKYTWDAWTNQLLREQVWARGLREDRDFTYDDAGRLVIFTRGAITESYGYDTRGNRISRTRTEAGALDAVDTWTYDARNRLDVSTEEGDYAWTARGTLLSITKGADVRSYTFDDFDQMISAEGVDYTYDGLGRLHTRTEAGDVDSFRYAGHAADPSADGDGFFGRLPSGQVVSRSGNDQHRVVGSDRHGDVVYLAETDGTVTATNAFDPFGKSTHAWTSGPANPVNDLGYQGDWTDPTTGDVNMHARWYSPTSGTFNSRDSYPGELSTPISLNRYTYGLNNPVRYHDPTGYCVADLGPRFAEANGVDCSALASPSTGSAASSNSCNSSCRGGGSSSSTAPPCRDLVGCGTSSSSAGPPCRDLVGCGSSSSGSSSGSYCASNCGSSNYGPAPIQEETTGSGVVDAAVQATLEAEPLEVTLDVGERIWIGGGGGCVEALYLVGAVIGNTHFNQLQSIPARGAECWAGDAESGGHEQKARAELEYTGYDDVEQFSERTRQTTLRPVLTPYEQTTFRAAARVVAPAAFQLLVFDYTQCAGESASRGGCTLEVALAGPWGRLAKGARISAQAIRNSDEVVDVVSKGAPSTSVGGEFLDDTLRMSDLPLPSATTVDDILASPHGLLTGRSPSEVASVLGEVRGWSVESLSRGSREGDGWVFREYTSSGNPTGRMLRWHPGGGHHGPDPYWRANDFQSSSGLIPG